MKKVLIKILIFVIISVGNGIFIGWCKHHDLHFLSCITNFILGMFAHKLFFGGNE